MIQSSIFLFALLSKEDSAKKHGDPTDEQLVETIVIGGDAKLFGHLYDRYATKVYNKCYSFVKDKDEAKDLAQDVFLRAYLKLNSFDVNKAAFSTWLYVITYNLCANYVTRYKNEHQQNKSKLAKKLDSANSEEIEIDEINQLDPDKLALALDAISPEDKALLLLKYQDDTSVKEIQELLGVGESAVKMRLNRAKLKVVKTYNSL